MVVTPTISSELRPGFLHGLVSFMEQGTRKGGAEGGYIEGKEETGY